MSEPEAPEPGEGSRPAGRGDDRPVVPDRGEADRDEFWGERVDEAEADERRLLEDRPPHHDGRSSW